jgi:hypothetical protein
LYQIIWNLLSYRERQILDMYQVELLASGLTFKKDLNPKAMLIIGQIIVDLHYRINDEDNHVNFALGDWINEVSRLSGQEDFGVNAAMQYLPTPMYSCFISYSNVDNAFATKLYQMLNLIRIPTWYAPQDIQGGRKIYQQLNNAISETDRMLVILSETSLRSQWVITEIRKARQLEINAGIQKLFPIRLVPIETIQKWECFDADTGRDIAVEIREYFISDFSDWEDSTTFEKSFSRLIDDLKKT